MGGDEQGGLDGHGAVFVVWVGGVVPSDGGVYVLTEEGLVVSNAALGGISHNAGVDVRRS